MYGIRYQRDGPVLRPMEDTVALDDPAIRWTVAAQLVRPLHDCTIVNLDAWQGARAGIAPTALLRLEGSRRRAGRPAMAEALQANALGA